MSSSYSTTPVTTSCKFISTVSWGPEKGRFMIISQAFIAKREYFTKHGLHLNSSGKECIAQRLTAVVKIFFTKERMFPICLQLKEDTTISDQDRNNNDSYVTSCNEVTVPQSQPSKSPKETLG